MAGFVPREEVGDAEGVEKGVMEWQRFGHTQLGTLPFHRLPPVNSGKGKGSGSRWLQEKPRVWQSTLANPRMPGRERPKMYLCGWT